MIAVTRDTFGDEVLGQPGLVLVDWWGPRCAPCLALMPKMELLEQEFSGRVRFTKVNAQENRRLAVETQTMALPTIALYSNGVKVDHLAGSDITIDQIRDRILAVSSSTSEGEGSS